MDDQFELDNMLFDTNTCASYDLEDLNLNVNLLDSKVNILHLNIRSCNKNMDEFLSFLEAVKMKFSIIILTETWLKDSINDINIPGYVCYHSTRIGNRRGGEVTILI